MITTSYYARVKKIPTPVAISRGVPQWYTGGTYGILAPPYNLVRSYKEGSITDELFKEEFYKSVLYKYDPVDVYNDIVSRFGSDATLICYEKAGDFCHRRIVAEWLENSLNVEVPELIF